MRTMQRPWWAVLGLTLSCLPATTQNAPPPTPAASPQAAAADAVAATVNGQPIPESAVQRGLQRVPPAKHADARPQILNYLIDQVLLDQYLKQLNITIDPKEIDKRIDELKAEQAKRNQDFTKLLAELKMTEAELRDIIANEMRWEKFAEERANDKALKELFDAKKYLFDGSTVHARHILLTPQGGDAKAAEQAVAQLQAIKQQIDKQVADELAKLPAGTDNLTREKKRQSVLEEAFAAQAKEKSACPSKAQGGDVGSFQGVGFMVEPFSRAAFALKPYEMSDVIKTPFGYHLLLVTERKPGRDVKFEEVKEMVKEHYCTSLHDTISSQGREKSKIVVNPAPK
jgi:peptidyl-prolyl cis-trans isomerase C